MTSPQFVRTQPSANVAAPAQAEVDPTNGWNYSPMGEDNPEDHLLKAPAVRPALAAIVRVAHPLPKSKIPVSKMNPEQAATYRAATQESKDKSLEWMKQNPRSADNIVKHWDQSTPAHKDQGMNWYPDAHHAANVIARDHGITTNQAAGLIANYSPQQHWAQNLRMASLAAGGQVIGGPKDPNSPAGTEGFMASKSQADAAKRILGGEDYHDIFAGKKIKAFGHLIEHGGDTDPNDPQVVVDRHALGVAHGGFADDGVYTHSGVSGGVRKDGSSPVYDETSQMYKDAADTINKRDDGHNGVPIQAHQLQAATWLTRQRLNAEGGYSGDGGGNKGATHQKIALGNTEKWNAHAAIHHPELVNKVPGTGFSNAVGQGGLANPQDFTAPTAVPGKAASIVRTASSAFTYDADADQYKTSDLNAPFRCNCGTKFASANIGLHRCEGCKKTYTSFDIIDGNRTASSGNTLRVVREVKEFRDRVLARKSSLQTPSYVRR